MYRHPNSHRWLDRVRSTGRTCLERHPGLQTSLREAVVGPGDVFYLLVFWWHQFEQPFEDSVY